ncbi:MAG: hypothetical protein ACPG4Q_06045 [Phycisphaeraceae bacterium]
MKRWNLIAGLVLLTLCLGITQADEKAKTLFNDKCPISNRDVNESKTSDYKVEFCCKKCKAKFDDAPGTHMDKVAKAEPGTCIFNGNPAKTSSTLTIGFCCGGCKGKFDDDPKKYIGKVSPAVKEEK